MWLKSPHGRPEFASAPLWNARFLPDSYQLKWRLADGVRGNAAQPFDDHQCVHVSECIDFRRQGTLLARGRTQHAPVIDCFFQFGQGNRSLFHPDIVRLRQAASDGALWSRVSSRFSSPTRTVPIRGDED